MPPIAWLDLLAQRETSVGPQNVSRPPVVEPLLVLSGETFETAVRDALTHYRRPDQLNHNPLLGSRLVRGDRSGETTQDPAQRLQDIIRDAAATMEADPRRRKYYKALYHTYFQPAPTQEAAAETANVPYGSFRRHLKRGINLLTACGAAATTPVPDPTAAVSTEATAVPTAEPIVEPTLTSEPVEPTTVPTEQPVTEATATSEPVAAAGEMDTHQMTATSVSGATDLRTALTNLLGEHVLLAASATNAALDGRDAEFEAAAVALDQNTLDLGAAIGSVYGADAEAAFVPLWRSHIDFYVDGQRLE